MKTLFKKFIQYLLFAFKPFMHLWAQNKYFNSDKFSYKKVSIVACHWIGDTFWASQVLPVLQKKWPDAVFYVFTKSHSIPLWNGMLKPENITSANAVISDRKREKVNYLDLFRLATKYRSKQFDLVIDLTGNRYSAIFSFLLKPSHSVGFNGNELGWLYSKNVQNAERSDRHLSERPFRVIEPLINEFAYSGKFIFPQVNSIPYFSQATVMILPGAGWKEKEWGMGNYINLSANLISEYKIILAGSEKEKDLCLKIAENIHTDRIQVLTGHPLDEIISLIPRMAFIVGNDSGICHIAAAMGVKTITIFTGSTDPKICGPIGNKVRIFDTNALQFDWKDVIDATR